jgi:very-short-patch-repair endonuclease
MLSTEDRLRRLLRSRALRPYRFNARCEIGPFVVANVCPERSLVVELQASADERQRQQQRAAFLAGRAMRREPCIRLWPKLLQ